MWFGSYGGNFHYDHVEWGQTDHCMHIASYDLQLVTLADGNPIPDSEHNMA
jgi:hypothetical protein